MIRFLRGVLTYKTDSLAVIDISGVGFEVWISLMTYRDLPTIDNSVALQTAMIVKEDDMRLYGFSTDQERELFQVLLSLNGVGAKMALDVLSHISHEQLVHAIQNNEPALLCQVPGIGKKRAEKILFDLQRMKNPILLASAGSYSKASIESPASENAQEAFAALQALGLKPQEATKAIAAAMKELGDDTNVANLIKTSLKHR